MAQPHEGSSDGLTTLPLFPLNLVLFPGMDLPLHIFEDRYKDMVGDCIDRKEPFGVVLIKEGQEVGEPAEPFQVGTAAQIVQVEHLAEGRINIVTRGQHRFQTGEIIQRSPHIVGQVQYLGEQVGEVTAELVAETSEQYSIFLRNLSA